MTRLKMAIGLIIGPLLNVVEWLINLIPEKPRPSTLRHVVTFDKDGNRIVFYVDASSPMDRGSIAKIESSADAQDRLG